MYKKRLPLYIVIGSGDVLEDAKFYVKTVLGYKNANVKAVINEVVHFSV